MIPLPKANRHKTIKMPEELLDLVKVQSSKVSMTESKFIVLSLYSILEMIEQPGKETVPWLVFMAQQANAFVRTPLRSHRKQGVGSLRQGRKRGQRP